LLENIKILKKYIMKQLVELSSDFIIDAKFAYNLKEGKVDWIDDKKKEAKGKMAVMGITVLVTCYSSEGYPNGLFNKVSLTRYDILTLAEKIKEIESKDLVGNVNDDLPF
jgi:hypothetical protein